MSNIREHTVHATTTDTFGRVLLNARQHHFVIDGPVQNQCPGEALTPAESFLAGVAACGVELVQVIAKEDGVAIGPIHATIRGMVDRDHPVRADLTVFNQVAVTFRIANTPRDTAVQLVQKFQKRCPLYGTVAAACPDVSVEVAG
ncbi:MAG: OsmC family protein [Gemmatimonadaceae bacterium]|nr:OsmC family protein [Gemmatimonadaceae bacterium]